MKVATNDHTPLFQVTRHRNAQTRQAIMINEVDAVQRKNALSCRILQSVIFHSRHQHPHAMLHA